VLGVLDALAAEGKVAAYAWLTDEPDRVRRFAQGAHCVAAPQLLNVLEHSDRLIALSEELGLSILTRRPLGMGLLTGKFGPQTRFDDNDMRQRFGWNFTAGKQAQLARKLEAVREVLAAGGRTLAQGALGWVWGRSPMAVPVPGFKNVQQVEENVGAVGFGPLVRQQMDQIAAALTSPV
jgi:aryl-alcohol dehydrogenase-like predicted oxidoreductase